MGGRLSRRGRQIAGMSVAEIKAAIDALSDEERIFVSAYLRRRMEEDSAAGRAELTAIRDEMEQGKKFSFEQLKKRHEELSAEGL